MSLPRVKRGVGWLGFMAMSMILFQAQLGLCEDQTLEFTTSDQVRISTLWRQGDPQPKERLIIVAPGFAQHSGTKSMQALATALTATADVLIVNFRGNGPSQGTFTFGSREYLDLEPVLAWSKSYADVTLMGFSLGAYHSLCSIHAHPNAVKRLLLVSCPTRVEDIVLSGGAFINPLVLMFRNTKFQHPAENDIFFRWGWPFSGKTEGSVLAADVSVPVHFLVAGKDTLVFERLTQQVCAAVPGVKTYTRMDEGLHAEAMFLQFPDEFLRWVEQSMGL